MAISGNLLAWIEPRGTNEFVGAFIGEEAVTDAGSHACGRLPATQVCSSTEDARQWIEEQATEVGLAIKWVSGFPQGQLSIT